MLKFSCVDAIMGLSISVTVNQNLALQLYVELPGNIFCVSA